MKITFLVLANVLMLTVLAEAQSPTLTAIPNTVFVGADGKFETSPDTALIQFNISAQAAPTSPPHCNLAQTSLSLVTVRDPCE